MVVPTLGEDLVLPGGMSGTPECRRSPKGTPQREMCLTGPELSVMSPAGMSKWPVLFSLVLFPSFCSAWSSVSPSFCFLFQPFHCALFLHSLFHSTILY